MAISGGDGSIILTTNVDTSGLNKGMASMQSGANKLMGSFGKLAVAIGAVFSVKAIISFSKEASKMATTTEASVQRLIDIYGSASQAVGDFIDANANALGMSKAAAANFASVYGNLFSVWADQATNAQLTTQYLNMTAVVASKTGRTMEDVQERIRSGLLGNTEAVEDLGIFVNIKTIEMTEAFQRVANGRSWEQLNAYEQSQVRTLAILEQATSKYGNTVAQNNALTRAQYNAAFQDFKNTWGTVINYILVPVLKALTKVFQYATAAMQAIFKISGKTINVDVSALEQQEQAIGGAVANQEDLTDAVKGTAKEQKKLLAGFDDLQILSQSSSESGGGGSSAGGGIGGGEISLPQFSEGETISPVDLSSFENLEKIFSNIQSIFMSGFWEGFQNADFSGIKQSISGIKESLTGIFTSPEVQTSAQGFASSVVFSFGQITGSLASIGRTIATNLLGGFNQYLQTNAPFIQTSLSSIFDASASMHEIIGNLWTAFANIFSVLSSENGQNLTANIIALFANSALSINELGTKIGTDFYNLISQPIIANQETLKVTIEQLLGVFNTLAESVSGIFSSLFSGLNDTYDKNIFPFMKSFTNGVTEIVNTFNVAFQEHISPVLQDFADTFGTVVDEHIKPAIDKLTEFIGSVVDLIKVLWENWLQPVVNWLVETLAPIFSEVFGVLGKLFNDLFAIVGDVFGSIFDILKGFVDFLTGVFSGDMSKAWEGIKEIWGGVVGFFTGIWDGIKSVFNTVATFFKDIFSKAWQGIVDVFSVAGEIFTNIKDGIIEAFKKIVNGIIDGINKVVKMPFEGLNKILDKIQNIEIAGIKPFEFLSWRAPVPQIPKLAQGAVIPPNREFMAILGDNKRENEIVSPVSTMKQAFTEAMLELGGNFGGGNTEIVLEIDGRELGRVNADLARRENRIRGTRLVLV